MPTYNKLGIQRVTSGSTHTDTYDPFTYEAGVAQYPHIWIKAIIPFYSISHATGTSNNGQFLIQIESNVDDADLEWTINNWSTSSAVIGGLIGLGGLDDGDYTINVRADLPDYNYDAEIEIKFQIYRIPTYGTKWKCNFSDLRGYAWQFRIKKAGYSSTENEICLAGDQPLVLNFGDGSNDDEFAPIVPSELTINLLKRSSDDFSEILTAGPYDYLVELAYTGTVYWQGWLLGDNYAESYRDEPYPMTFRAVCGLRSLNDLKLVYGGRGQTRWNDPRLSLHKAIRHILLELRLPGSVRHEFCHPVYPEQASGTDYTFSSLYLQHINCDRLYHGHDEEGDEPNMFDTLAGILGANLLRIQQRKSGFFTNLVELKTGSATTLYQTSTINWDLFSASSVLMDTELTGIDDGGDIEFIENDHVLLYRPPVRDIVLQHEMDSLSKSQDYTYTFAKQIGFGAGSTDVLIGSYDQFRVFQSVIKNPIKLEDQDAIGADGIQDFMMTKPQPFVRLAGAEVRFRIKFKVLWTAVVDTSFSIEMAFLAGGYVLTKESGGFEFDEIEIDGGGGDTTDLYFTMSIGKIESSGEVVTEDHQIEILTDALPSTLTMTDNTLQLRVRGMDHANSEGVSQLWIHDIEIIPEYYSVSGDNETEVDVADRELAESDGSVRQGEVVKPLMFWSHDDVEEGDWPESSIWFKDDDTRVVEYERTGETGTRSLQQWHMDRLREALGSFRKIFNGSFTGYHEYHRIIQIGSDYYTPVSLSMDIKRSSHQVRAVEIIEYNW